MSDEEFQNLVTEAIDALPERVTCLIENVAFVVEDEPSAEQRERLGLRPTQKLFGLYEGIPKTERGIYYSALPDKITIFKSTVLAAYQDPEDIRACVANTVWHEVAHHFGYGEEWIAREELRRGKTK